MSMQQNLGVVRAGAPLRIASAASTWRVAVVLIAVVALLALPFAIYPVFLMKLMCYALFAAAFNFLLGYAGLLSFGHAAFFGGAAYFTAHAAKVWQLGSFEAILFGTLCAAGMGLVVGFLAIRRQGVYFAMITLALSQLIYFGFLQAPFTYGEDGIQNVPRGKLFGVVDLVNNMNMYYFVLAMVVCGFFAMWRIINSPFGQILKAIRENERRAVSLGYRVARYKLAAFVISTAVAGLAGALKVLVFQFASLADIEVAASSEPIVMSLLGGIGTMLGPVVGAGIVVSLNSYLASWDFPVTVIIGTIFMFCVVLFRKGIVGEALELARRLRS